MEYEVCKACDGSGFIKGDECDACEGWGKLEPLEMTLDESYVDDSDMEDR